MNDDKPVEQTGTPLEMPDLPDWGNEVRIVEPGVNDEQGNEVRKEDGTTAEDQENEEDQEEAPAEQYEQPTPVVTVEDPGDYQPADYSFKVTTYDEEGKRPKTRTIKSVDEFNELLDEDANFGSSSELLKAQRLATKMEMSEERDKAEWQKKKDAFNQQNDLQKNQYAYINEIAAEMSYLETKGRLPKVAKEYENANWSDPDVAKQPGVKERLALLDYMRKENDIRARAGITSRMSVIDAQNAMRLEAREKAAKDARKTAGDARKQAGARVAGNSPAPAGNLAPKGISIGSVGKGDGLRGIGSW